AAGSGHRPGPVRHPRDLPAGRLLQPHSWEPNSRKAADTRSHLRPRPIGWATGPEARARSFLPATDHRPQALEKAPKPGAIWVWRPAFTPSPTTDGPHLPNSIDATNPRRGRSGGH